MDEKDNTFKSYKICFSSDIETFGKSRGQKAKVSVATFFSENYGRIQIQEFLVRNGDGKRNKIDVLSIKQVFFSKELLQDYQQSGYIKNSYLIPFQMQEDKSIKGV